MAEVSKEELEKALRFVYRRHQKKPGILNKSSFLNELVLGLQAEVGLAKIDAEKYVDNFFNKYKDTKLFTEKFSFNNLAEAGIDVTKATIGEELAKSIEKGAEFANKSMTDKKRIERILKIINLEYPDIVKLGERMGEVYKILAMDELELLTLDQYKGQNMDFVLEQLQKEGLELGDKIRELDREIAKRFDVSVTDLQSDLALLNEFDVENIRDLPKDALKEIKDTSAVFNTNIPDDASSLFDDIEQLDFDGPNITLNPDGSTTEIIESSYTDDLGIEYGVSQEINRDVPLEEFKTLFGGRPSDYKMPEILDDLKDTLEYSQAQFQLWSMELEYQDRQKFKNIINRQYEIFYEFLKENPNISLENKKTLLAEIRKRTFMLDEEYRDFTVKKDVDLSLEELTKFDNELDNINTNFKSKLEAALDNLKLGQPNDLNRDIRNLQIDELDIKDEYKKYLKEIMRDTDTPISPETIRKLDNVLDTKAGQNAVETIILNMRNGITKHGTYSLHHLMYEYGANYFDVMGAKQDIAQEYWSRIDEIIESHLNPNAVNPDIEMKIQFDFAESKLKELGVSDIKIEDALENNKFFQTNKAFTDPEMLNDLDKLLVDNEFNNIVSNTNVVDDKLSTFDTTLNSADGNVEFYIKHQGTQVSANDIRYNPNLGSDTEKFIPGFYGEPVGDVSAETMGIKSQDNPVSNYYKVQVNTDNLLITQPDGILGNQIDKVDWNIFAKETGVSLSDIKNPKKQNVNSLINQLKLFHGLDDGTIAEAFRKSGIEGFVELKGNWREVVLIDPNDDLGIGRKLNIEDATELEFLNNQSKVNQLDELVIKPAPVVDNVVDIREMQLKKLMQEVEDATPDVIKITPSQAEMIDNALADAAAQLNRGTFKVIEGGLGRKITAQEILQIAGKRLGKLFVDGITLIDIYELGLLAYAFGEPIVELVTKLIYPDYKPDDYTYGEQVMQNFEVITKISPTDRLLMKAADEIEEKFGFRPGDVSKEIFSEDTSPVRPVLYSPDTKREIPLESYVPKTIYDITKQKFQPDTLEEKTSYGEYKQFLSGLNGMIGG